MTPPFSPAEWWGAKGCRYATEPGHVCLDVFGRPVAGSHPCVAEARSAIRDLFDSYRVAL